MFSNEAKIVSSWRQNAMPWTAAVRERQIESRRLVTDGAIVNAVVNCSPQTVLDVGCGEGWLVRALHTRGIMAHGVDGIPALVEQAQTMGGGTFEVAAYGDITAGRLQATFDVVVCNFSLFGDQSVVSLLRQIPHLLNPSGTFIIQTLHPIMACGEDDYTDGWRAGSWAGFSQDFMDPAPWYFRTMGSWVELLVESGLMLTRLVEPLHPGSGGPASVIFVAVVTSGGV
ncbi:MAG: class I SAM-dependent methyltransferase [Cyanobacteria bacterium J06628_4]